MKRWRVTSMEFDMSANILDVVPGDDWDPRAKEAIVSSQANIREDLTRRFGVLGFERKLENYRALGVAPFSLVAFHNRFFKEVRAAFVVGGYYPALTGICALGERVLNHLVLKLREEFNERPEYKRVYRKDSFDNWDIAIDTLDAWAVLVPNAVASFRRLRDLRNGALHFNAEAEGDVRPAALEAVHVFQKIIEAQFASFGACPWYIPNDIGLTFVRRDYEHAPFVKLVVLPNCHYVGPAHDTKRRADGASVIVDKDGYPDAVITDEDFIDRFKAAH